MTRIALSLEPDTYDVPLGDVTYTTRPYTNLLRSKLGKLLDERATLGDFADRLQLRQARIDETTDDEVLTQLQKDIDDHAAKWRDVNRKLIVELLVDPDGAAPPLKLIDEHAGSRAISRVVGTVLGLVEPNPTTASTDAA
ncbi:unannotated protein [freshwater metagenome]|uniref:Unannotated protein n=1 Tax=freshwater metagenome TaxID=449393 RepID=A0A6J7FM72_9ZZZZ|nr:hypothetical protein [Actinomycetota bacterium]